MASGRRRQIVCPAFATVATIARSVRLACGMDATGVILVVMLVYAMSVCGPIEVGARALIRCLSATAVTFWWKAFAAIGHAAILGKIPTCKKNTFFS